MEVGADINRAPRPEIPGVLPVDIERRHDRVPVVLRAQELVEVERLAGRKLIGRDGERAACTT